MNVNPSLRLGRSITCKGQPHRHMQRHAWLRVLRAHTPVQPQNAGSAPCFTHEAAGKEDGVHPRVVLVLLVHDQHAMAQLTVELDPAAQLIPDLVVSFTVCMCVCGVCMCVCVCVCVCGQFAAPRPCLPCFDQSPPFPFPFPLWSNTHTHTHTHLEQARFDGTQRQVISRAVHHTLLLFLILFTLLLHGMHLRRCLSHCKQIRAGKNCHAHTHARTHARTHALAQPTLYFLSRRCRCLRASRSKRPAKALCDTTGNRTNKEPDTHIHA